MLVAIDGPAGAGKSTVARAAADALGFTYLNSGAMYRAVALAGDRDPASLHIAFDGDRVLLDGEDVTERIRTPEISRLASERAADPAVREALVVKQRELLANGDWVAEGRDIGTVVFPKAEVKLFVTAHPRERARRRHLEMLGRGQEATLEAVEAEMAARDARDAARDVAPLIPAPDALLLDTTDLDAEAAFRMALALIAGKSKLSA